jgi:CRP-like cAMP-binding protein
VRKHSLQPILKKHPFLKGLTEKHLALLTGCAENLRFEANQYLFEAGGPAEHFYLVREGRVALELPRARHGKAMVLQTVDAGGVVGWSWLVPPYEWHFSARAVEPVMALRFDGKCLRVKAQKDRDFGYEVYRRFLGVVAQRLIEALPQIVGICR